ncbi:unnamed protein product [Tuber aestivum]|uniref:GAF domain-containing protein n=1 Tax=Tuber aestivum TaxID=59557 RepID=A0A292PLR3_9PEZI|nr:unnamed protein product [Tuber aestivum]
MAIHSTGPRSAFSDSSTSSLVARPTDKSFLKRLFNRGKPRAATLPTSHSTFELSERYARRENNFFVLPPSPHTHPLLSKPYARDELRPRSSTNYSHLDGSIVTGGDGFIHARRVAAMRPAGRSVDSGVSPEREREREMYARGIREREKAAREAAVEGRYVQEWGFFIKCYAEGRFNVSNPPDPPPRRPDFNHLTAPLPPNEKQRLEAVNSCNVSLPPDASDKYHRLVLLARRVLNVRMASISLVDETVEIFKAEHAFNRKYVDRSESIGAHVLLSNEPMVVLDLTKDWRLKGNPLVKGAPYIRFYAGAPIITFDGQIIGTFSVFDDTPRDSFGVAERRKLMDFARLAMTEIENVVEERDMRSRRTPTPVIDLRVLHEQDQQSLLGDRLKASGGGAPVSPRSSPKPAQGPTNSRTARKRDAPTPVNRPVAIRPGGRLPTINIPVGPEDCRNSRTCAKISDMPTPPHTPSRPFSFTTNSSRPLGSVDGASSRESSEEGSTDRRARYKQRKPSPTQAPGPREVPLQVPFSSGPITSLAEASFATSIIARSLDYDFVYLLRVSPVAPQEPRILPLEQEYTGDNFHTKVLVAHGLPNPLPVFDANLHLRALRSAGGLVYQNPARSQDEDDVGFRSGILLPLLRDGVDNGPDEGYSSATTPIGREFQQSETACTGGIVLAAFTRKDERDSRPPFTADEVRCLREFGEAMKDILLRVDRRF